MNNNHNHNHKIDMDDYFLFHILNMSGITHRNTYNGTHYDEENPPPKNFYDYEPYDNCTIICRTIVDNMYTCICSFFHYINHTILQMKDAKHTIRAHVADPINVTAHSDMESQWNIIDVSQL